MIVVTIAITTGMTAGISGITTTADFIMNTTSGDSIALTGAGTGLSGSIGTAVAGVVKDWR